MRELWLARAYFFFWIGGVGFYAPFINLFYRQQGMSGAEIGLIITIGSVVGLVAALLWGRWSDSGASLTRILQLGLLLTGIALLVLSQQNLFLVLAFAASFVALGSAGLFPLSDALALRISRARRAGYGSVRVFGSAGWALIVLFSGWLLERGGLVVGFYGAVVLFIIAGLLLFRFPKGIHAPDVMRAREPGGLRHAAKQVLQTPALLGLAIALIVRGILSDGHMQFGNIYLEELGASTALIGVASMVQAAVELPGMFIADRVVRRLGALSTLLISFSIAGSKFLLVLLFPSVWSVMTTRAIEGISFSLFTIGLITYVTGRAPSAQMATMLALFTVTLTAFIQILGAPIGGIVFDAVGAYWLYALALVGNALAFVILLAFNARQPKPALEPS